MADDTAPPEAKAPIDAKRAPEPAPLSLVYLDVDDEITSAAARIRAAGADEVALVLPFGSRLATSRINFRLLARDAAERGKKIEIICADGSARALAIAAGLPTHASVAAFEAQRAGGAGPAGTEAATAGSGAIAATDASRETAAASTAAPAGTGSSEATATTGVTTQVGTPAAAGGATTRHPAVGATDAARHTRVLPSPRRKSPSVPRVGPPRPPVRTGVAVGVGLAVIAAVIAGGLLALELLPSATITLHPRAEALGPLDITVEAREDVAAPDPEALTIPAQRFTFPVEASQTFPATGIRIEEVKATGNVTFSNFDTGGGVVIPEGTIVETEDGIEFATQGDVTLPRARIDFFPPFPVQPSTASVGVEAVDPGPDGNVGNNAISEVPRAGRNLRVTNEEATTGGARTELPEVSAEDVEAAKTALTAALVGALDEQILARAGVPAAVTLFPGTGGLGEPEYSVDPETLVGTEGTEFDLGATAEGTALGVDPSPIGALAEARMAARVAEGWTLQSGSVATDIGNPLVLGTAISYPVSIDAMQVRDVDQAALLDAIRGLAIPDARSRLDDFGDVDIAVWPEWVTEIPTRTDRVVLNLAAPQPSAPPGATAAPVASQQPASSP